VKAHDGNPHAFGYHLSPLRLRQARGNAGECLPGSLRVQSVRHEPAAKAGRLLRLLLLRLDALPAGASGPIARGRASLALAEAEAQAEQPADNGNAGAECQKDDADHARRLEIAGLDIFELKHGEGLRRVR